ncbi:hypothetical protein BJ878DRAFT_448219 [Calycina marina]|uniref:Secreted protein n=1 Tax=Calycina marina TaxID=1763456 RepID=A0A9P8CBY7_9HELO|nr:hypothetical protein BJ878DRAFT_448219 [Calycina marina]
MKKRMRVAWLRSVLVLGEVSRTTRTGQVAEDPANEILVLRSHTNRIRIAALRMMSLHAGVCWLCKGSHSAVNCVFLDQARNMVKKI